MNTREAMANLRWYRTRFADPGAEAEYRIWRIWRTLPLAKLAAGVSIPVWMLAPWIWYSLWGAAELLDVFLVFGLIVPGMAMAFVIERTPLIHWGPQLSSAVLVLAGGQFMYRTALGVQDSVSLMTLGGVLFAMFAPLIRLPTLWTLLSTSALLIPCIGYNLAALAEPGAPSADLGGNVVMLIMTIFFVVTMSVVNEVSLRRSYLAELQVASQQAAIHRYLPTAVARHILDGDEEAISEPQRRRVTMLFADIANFTEMADRVEPEAMTEVLSDHLSAMTEIIEAHGGTLNEFAGDGLMALFGAPDTLPPEAQVLQAVKAAQAMQQRMPELNASWRKLGLGTQLAIRIGINTGMVSVGSYGSAGRRTYTAIGLQTNIAARIEAAAEPGQILLSDASYQLVRDEMECTAAGEVDCKGVHYPIAVYRPALSKSAASP